MIVALSLRPAGSLLKKFRSIKTNVYAHFTNVSSHPGALVSMQKVKLGQQLQLKCGLIFLTVVSFV